MVRLRNGLRQRVDVSRVLFYTLGTLAVLGSAYFVGMTQGAAKAPAYFFWNDLRTSISESVSLVVSEAPTFTGRHPVHFLQASRYEGTGVTINDPGNDQTDLLMLSGFFDDTNELRLIRRNGDIVARWPVSYHELVPDPSFFPAGFAPATDWNIGMHGAVVMPDGSVVFNFNYGGTVKLDRCNKVQWVVRRQTHHSVERAEAGGVWVPGRRLVSTSNSPYSPFEPPFHEDTIMHISDEGEILSETSAVKLLYDNGLKALLTATGSFFKAGMEWDQEILHLNKIDELKSDLAAEFPMFEAGDLVLSIRELNLIMVVDRTATRVKWWKVGPWLRQHDPEFVHGGRILLFNNNIFGTVFGDTEQKTPPDTPRVSEIIAVDPETGRTEVRYGGKPDMAILSVVRGKVAPTPRGGLLITEADGGRARETNKKKQIVWEYVNRYSPEELAELTEARLYPADYFTFDAEAWPCPSR